ncbi:hypothetical protein GIB67_016443 [Kingdonia uniflora]|uniref:RNase H type-1 domain-containing protein n=1 Tax=Kingdonia uniflora TaxID=39325 RepID=A0A7J7MH53_9MAGN|nr:hypothetical protein GIB67_016443 [Kingdonia uniflora]
MSKKKRDLFSHIRDTAHQSKSQMKNSVGDLSVLHKLQVPLHPRMFQQIKSYFWKIPNVGVVKINFVRSSRGNPEKGGAGFIIINHTGTFMRTYSYGLGNFTSYMAECSTLLQGLQDASYNGWLIAWSESDFVVGVEAFNNDNVP